MLKVSARLVLEMSRVCPFSAYIGILNSWEEGVQVPGVCCVCMLDRDSDETFVGKQGDDTAV